MFGRAALVALFVALSANAYAELDFRSIAEGAAVTYDSPSLKGRKLAILSRNYPVEVLVLLAGWAKVRDANGEIAWVENKALSEQRSVLVRVPIIEVRHAADDKAPVAFRAEQNVVLEYLEHSAPGWVKIKHSDGQIGYAKTNQLWGV